MCVLVVQSCLTLYDPMDCSSPGSSVHGILQARILEWIAFPSPGDLPNLGIESRSPALQADALLSEPLGRPFIDKLKLKRLVSCLKTHHIGEHVTQTLLF